jgi:hypothetical protein
MAHQHHGTGRSGSCAEVRVEHVAAQRHRVFGQVGAARPRCADLASAVGQADPGEAVAAELQGVDIEQAEFSECSWGERVTARLVARDRSLLDDGDVMARLGEPGGDRCPCGTTADDEDVGVQGASPVSPPEGNRGWLRGRPA